MTVEQIVKHIRDSYEKDGEHDADDDFQYLIREGHYKQRFQRITGFDFDPIENERENEMWRFVFKLKGCLWGFPRFFRIDASYDSWQGIDFYDGVLSAMYEVKPVEVTITQYERIA